MSAKFKSVELTVVIEENGGTKTYGAEIPDATQYLPHPEEIDKYNLDHLTGELTEQIAQTLELFYSSDESEVMPDD